MQEKLLKFILIPTSNCKHCMTKNGEDLEGFLVSWEQSFLFFEKVSNNKLIPSFDLLLPNFNQIMRKWESFLALFPFLEIEMLRPNPTSGVSLTNIQADGDGGGGGVGVDKNSWYPITVWYYFGEIGRIYTHFNSHSSIPFFHLLLYHTLYFSL